MKVSCDHLAVTLRVIKITLNVALTFLSHKTAGIYTKMALMSVSV